MSQAKARSPFSDFRSDWLTPKARKRRKMAEASALLRTPWTKRRWFSRPHGGYSEQRSYRWLTNVAAVAAVVAAFAMILTKNAPGSIGKNQLLNVSYDPTRELYEKIDAEFADQYRKESGQTIVITQSHGGSARQARKVISGEEPADVVTLALYSDVDALRMRGLIAGDWAERLPNHSSPTARRSCSWSARAIQRISTTGLT